MSPTNNQRWIDSKTEFESVGIQDPDENWISIDKDGKFWFWNEVQTDCYGPFDTHQQAVDSATEYAKTI